MSTRSPYKQCRPPDSPNLHKKAVKLSPSQHEGVLLGTVVLVAAAIIRLTAPGGFLMIQETAASIIFWVGVSVYLLLAIPQNQLLMHLLTLAPTENYQKICSIQKEGKARFCFSICCYKEHSSQFILCFKHKSIIRMVQKVVEPANSEDDGREAPTIKERSLYTIVNFSKGYETVDQESESSLKSRFNHFVEGNSVGTQQKFQCRFQIEGFRSSIGFGGNSGRHYLHVFLMFLLTFTGLAYPACLWVERSVRRYEVKLVKKVTM